MNKKIVNTGLHVVLWVLFLILPVLLLPELQQRMTSKNCHLINYLALNATLVFYFYFNYSWAIPKLYFKQKYLRFIAVHIAATLGVYLFIIAFNQIFTFPCIPDIDITPIKLLNRSILPRHILIFLVSFLTSINVRLKSIEEEKTKADLQLLRTQINPHFLFNVLNTIYGQAIIKSENTADSIAKLSDLMRYALKEANVPLVSLQKEITYLESYIALQAVRLTDKTNVDFQINGPTEHLKIPPMLFIPFIENAFKYGVSNEVNTTIKIIIEVIDRQVTLLVENSIVSNQSNIEESNQFGINNVKNRLDLIYGNKYNLTIKDAVNHYKVYLEISA